MPEIVLPKPGPHMLAKLSSPARHGMWCAGRRARKTTCGVIAAVEGRGPRVNGAPMFRGALQGANGWIVDQNHPSATTLWYALRGMLRPIAKHISEADRRILLHGDGAITVKSAASVNSLVGDYRGIDFLIMNEGAKYDPLVWQKALRPAISDTKGWTFWPSTPEGMNYYYDLFESARSLPDWEVWQEPSTCNPFFDPAEIEQARREGTPDNLIRQEYYAEFILSGAGRTYHEFERADHVEEIELDPSLPLDLCVSFGVAPAAWLVTQGERGNERCLAEILPPNGEPSVRAFAQEFRKRFPRYARGTNLRVFGEVTGKATGHSDFEAIRAEFPATSGARHFIRAVAYDEKDRINAVNATLRNRYGDVSGHIAPGCDRLIRDLESTRNADASFRVDHRKAGVGHYAAAWGCKLVYLYPAIAETMRAQVEDRRFPTSTPEARRAYSAVARAIEKGALKRPANCEECRKLCKPEAAHYNYAEPLRIRWLCHGCHTIWDQEAPKGGTVGR